MGVIIFDENPDLSTFPIPEEEDFCGNPEEGVAGEGIGEEEEGFGGGEGDGVRDGTATAGGVGSAFAGNEGSCVSFCPRYWG